MPYVVSKYIHYPGRVKITISDDQVIAWYQEIEAQRARESMEDTQMICADCLEPAQEDDYLCLNCRGIMDLEAMSTQETEEERRALDALEAMRLEAMEAGYRQAIGAP